MRDTAILHTHTVGPGVKNAVDVGLRPKTLWASVSVGFFWCGPSARHRAPLLPVRLFQVFTSPVWRHWDGVGASPTFAFPVYSRPGAPAPDQPRPMLIYAWTLAVAFMVLTVHLYPQLTLTELAFAAIPVGSIGGAWLFYLVAMLLNFLRCGALPPPPILLCRRGDGSVP